MFTLYGTSGCVYLFAESSEVCVKEESFVPVKLAVCVITTAFAASS